MEPERSDPVLDRVALEAITERSFIGDDEAGTLARWRARIHPEDVARAEETIEQALSSGASSWSAQYRARRADGAWAWIAEYALVDRDSEGRPLRARIATLDVTELRQQHERLKLFTEQLPARATISDRGLRVFGDIGAGFPDRPSTLGKTVPELFASSPDRDRVLASCERALAGETSRLEIDDGNVAAQLDLVPMRDATGNVTGVIGLGLDITERRRAHQTAPHVETACFRIMQEALTNVIRHAAATSVSVELHADADRIELVVRDDGKGFDAKTAQAAAAAGKSHGLLNMHERAELASGELVIESHSGGGGTTVRAVFPQVQERKS